jgi:hypothetical protein
MPIAGCGLSSKNDDCSGVISCELYIKLPKGS